MQTSENWYWDIAVKDIARLRARDVETINKVYFANYDKFKNVCRKRFGENWEDALQSIYLLLPYLSYDNKRRFFTSLLWGCRQLIFGRNRLHVTSLDSRTDETEMSLYDKLFFEDEYFSDQLEEDLKIIRFLENQRGLTARQKDMLCAEAFGIRDYEGLYEDERKFMRSCTKFRHNGSD